MDGWDWLLLHFYIRCTVVFPFTVVVVFVSMHTATCSNLFICDAHFIIAVNDSGWHGWNIWRFKLQMRLTFQKIEEQFLTFFRIHKSLLLTRQATRLESCLREITFIYRQLAKANTFWSNRLNTLSVKWRNIIYDRFIGQSPYEAHCAQFVIPKEMPIKH